MQTFSNFLKNPCFFLYKEKKNKYIPGPAPGYIYHNTRPAMIQRATNVLAFFAGSYYIGSYLHK